MQRNLPDYMQKMILNSPSAMAIVDVNLCYLALSGKWMEEFKLKEDLTGKSHLAAFPQISAYWKDKYTAALQGYCSKAEEMVLSPDGSVKYLRWEIQPFDGPDHSVVGLVMYIENISDQKEEEISLRKSLDLYHKANEMARVGIWEADLLKNTLFWSPVTKQIHGVPDDYEPELQAAFNFYKEGVSRNTLVTHFKRTVETGEPFDLELQLLRANGEELWIRAKGNAEFIDGKCSRLFGTFQDIQAQQQQRIQLINSEIKYRSIIENSLYGILLTIPGGFVQQANQAAMDIFGYTIEEFRTISRYQIFDINHPNLAIFIKQREELGKARAEITGIRKNGEHFPCEISAAFFTDVVGKRLNSIVIVDISTRKAAEEKIRISEEQFRGAFENSAIGMSLFDLTGKWNRVNQRLCDMLGYTKNELTEFHFQDMTHPEDVERNLGLLKKLAAGTINRDELEKRYIHKDGSVVWVLMGVSLVRDAKGEPLYCISQVQNITEKKIAENLVREERMLLRTLVDNLPINIYIKDLDSRKTMVNRSEIEYMNGLTEEEIIGKSDFELYPLKSAQMSFKEDKEVLDSGEAMISKETIDTREDGTTKYLLTSKIPLRNIKNELIGLLGISYDITHIKKAEQALAKSEEKYRKIFENIQDIYYSTNKDGIVTEISPSIEKYYNFKRENVIGTPVSNFYYHIEDQEKIMNVLKTDLAVTDFEVKLRSKANELIYASVNSRLLVEDNEVLGTEGIVRDITLRKIQENELTTLNTELKALNKHKEKLLSVVGHDLRNPIANALKLADLALMDINELSPKALEEYLSMIKFGLDNANGLLEDLLSWAASQFDSLDFNPVRIVDLKEHVDSCIKRISPIAEAKGIQLIQQLEDHISILADKDMLDAILRNIVSNAIKFTVRGGVVKISAIRRPGDILFSIADTGVGIDSSMLSRLFDKSFSDTTFGTSGEKGTGLGLDLCREFVEKHSGKIWAQSTKGLGSTFYFTIHRQKYE